MITKKSNEDVSKSIHDKDLLKAIALCRSKPVIFQNIRGIYHQLDRDIASVGAICLAGGNCCKFDLSDHHLYLTGIELALLTSRPPIDPARINRRRCPYQLGPRCSAYPDRPIGCRTFFCKSPWAKHGQRLHEKYHRRIRELHDALGVPYFYLELINCPASLFKTSPPE